jgi:hypothetical protein
MLELGYSRSSSDDDHDFVCGYRIYISGDTLLVSGLQSIPQHYTHGGKPIDLMLIHLGGAMIPGPSMPLLMVTVDAAQGIELVELVEPDVHYEYVTFIPSLRSRGQKTTAPGTAY